MAIDKVVSASIADDAVTSAKVSYNKNQFRNIIINGDMSLAQRATSVSSISSGTAYDTVDRFSRNIGSGGTWTISQSTDVPTGQGFAKSLKLDCTTANGSLSSNSEFVVRQQIEGQNLQYLKKGTSSAESTTLSFWVKSNKTGTYIAELRDADNNRQISQAYTISSADTWEKKTLTYAGDTTGAFGNDNGGSLIVELWLVAGSDFTSGTLSTTWTSSTNANRAVGQVNLADSTSNEWYITGVQLEAGTTASDFEFLPNDINRQRCQRYFIDMANQSGVSYSSTNGMTWNLQFPTTMRTAPSTAFNYSGTANRIYRLDNAATFDFTGPQIFDNVDGINHMYSSGTPGSGWANDPGTGFQADWTADAEL